MEHKGTWPHSFFFLLGIYHDTVSRRFIRFKIRRKFGMLQLTLTYFIQYAMSVNVFMNEIVAITPHCCSSNVTFINGN